MYACMYIYIACVYRDIVLVIVDEYYYYSVCLTCVVYMRCTSFAPRCLQSLT